MMDRKHMNKKLLEEKIRSLSRLEDWNHYFEFEHGVVTKNNNKTASGNNIKKWQRILPIMNKLSIKGKTVLDVGSSDGYFSIETARLGAKSVLGIDIDSLRIERANFVKDYLNIKNVDFRKDDIYNFINRSQSYDIVMALGVLHRIPDIYGFLSNLANVGRTLILEFKSLESNKSIASWGGGKSKGNDFNNLYLVPSVKMVSDILGSLGFDVETVKRDNSKLKFKRTILVATKKNVVKNRVFEKYKNIHNGKRVFLIGNGPSLAKTDLGLIENEYSIAMNRISLIYRKHKNWRPTYYLFSSTNVNNTSWGEEWLSSVRSAIIEKNTTSFIAAVFKARIDPKEELDVNWFESVSETRPGSMGEVSADSFSTDIVERVDKSGTSMSMALQLAYHMGFSEIIFLGADLGWTKDLGSQDDPNHFDKSYRADISNPYKANFQMRNIHKLAGSKFRSLKPNVKLYNASKCTVLDTYPIIDFEAYVKENKIVLREEELQLAGQFWENQVYEEPPKVHITKRAVRKLKRHILWMLKGK